MKFNAKTQTHAQIHQKLFILTILSGKTFLINLFGFLVSRRGFLV